MPRPQVSARATAASAGNGVRRPPGRGADARKIGAPQSRSGKRSVAPGTCSNCGVHEEDCSMWRVDDKFNIGEKVCNACGIYAKDHGRPRPPSVYLRRARLKEAQRQAQAQRRARAGPSSSTAHVQPLPTAVSTDPPVANPRPPHTNPVEAVPLAVLFRDPALADAALRLMAMRDPGLAGPSPDVPETQIVEPSASPSTPAAIAAQSSVASPRPSPLRVRLARRSSTRVITQEVPAPASFIDEASSISSEGSVTSEEQSPELVTPSHSIASLPLEDGDVEMATEVASDKDREQQVEMMAL